MSQVGRSWVKEMRMTQEGSPSLSFLFHLTWAYCCSSATSCRQSLRFSCTQFSYSRAGPRWNVQLQPVVTGLVPLHPRAGRQEPSTKQPSPPLSAVMNLPTVLLSKTCHLWRKLGKETPSLVIFRAARLSQDQFLGWPQCRSLLLLKPKSCVICANAAHMALKKGWNLWIV